MGGLQRLVSSERDHLLPQVARSNAAVRLGPRSSGHVGEGARDIQGSEIVVGGQRARSIGGSGIPGRRPNNQPFPGQHRQGFADRGVADVQGLRHAIDGDDRALEGSPVSEPFSEIGDSSIKRVPVAPHHTLPLRRAWSLLRATVAVEALWLCTGRIAPKNAAGPTDSHREERTLQDVRARPADPLPKLTRKPVRKRTTARCAKCNAYLVLQILRLGEVACSTERRRAL